MPKEEQPQTHENGEVQKLVDRIEKKVSAQRKNRSSKTPSKPPQQKRDLRVVKWLGTIPAIGVTYCGRQFKVPPESMKRIADAQWNLDLQFKEHKCKREDASQAAARIVRGESEMHELKLRHGSKNCATSPAFILSKNRQSMMP